jgi:hypothetical protein
MKRLVVSIAIALLSLTFVVAHLVRATAQGEPPIAKGNATLFLPILVGGGE